MTTKEKKKWLGDRPTNCQVCGSYLLDKFIDGRLQGRGTWAFMCTNCHTAEGAGLGVGNGQMYDADTLEKLEG